jgi:hypothetical protein
MTAGETFRAARQQRSLSIEDVSQRTKIRPKIIESMERDDFAALPATYMTGFVRTYAQFLDVNMGQMPDIAAFAQAQRPATAAATDVRASFAAAKKTNAERGITPDVDGTRSRRRGDDEDTESAAGTGSGTSTLAGLFKRKRSASAASAAKFAQPHGQPTWMKYTFGVGSAVLLAACGLLFWQKTFGLQTPELPPVNLPSLGTTTAEATPSAPPPKPLSITGDASTDKALINGGRSADAALSTVATTQANSTLSNALGTAIGNAIGGTPSAVPDSLVLEAKAIESAWINVVMDNKRNEQITLEAGKTYRWTAERLISLQLGNAGGVQFRLNHSANREQLFATCASPTMACTRRVRPCWHNVWRQWTAAGTTALTATQATPRWAARSLTRAPTRARTARQQAPLRLQQQRPQRL